jgi:hypothetical protein
MSWKEMNLMNKLGALGVAGLGLTGVSFGLYLTLTQPNKTEPEYEERQRVMHMESNNDYDHDGHNDILVKYMNGRKEIYINNGRDQCIPLDTAIATTSGNRQDQLRWVQTRLEDENQDVRK